MDPGGEHWLPPPPPCNNESQNFGFVSYSFLRKEVNAPKGIALQKGRRNLLETIFKFGTLKHVLPLDLDPSLWASTCIFNINRTGWSRGAQALLCNLLPMVFGKVHVGSCAIIWTSSSYLKHWQEIARSDEWVYTYFQASLWNSGGQTPTTLSYTYEEKNGT